MRVLVTGASGFIGTRLTTALAQAGYQVRAAARQQRGLNARSGFEVVASPDLTQPTDWQPIVSGMDAVVHLAGIAHVGPDIPETTYDRVNHIATDELAAAARAAGVKHFVFMSSTRAQAGASADQILRETDEPQPTDAYGRSKRAAEDAVRASGVPYTILRPALVYGPGVKGNLASLIRLAAMPIPLPFGAFDNLRSLVAVDNLIAAVRFALENERAVNETFLVADPNPVSVAELIGILRAAMGKSPSLVSAPPRVLSAMLSLIGRRDDIDRLAGTLVADTAKLLAAGWQPVADTKTAIAEMVQAASPRKSGTASRSTP